MTEYCISLFGKFQVKKEGLILKGFEAAKVQELFCYLLLHQNQPIHREYLATILWPERAATPSKKYLRKALWQLQRCLSQECRGIAQPIISADGEWFQLTVPASFQVDTILFMQAVETVQDIPGGRFSDEQAALISDVVKLYQGDLLQGWYQEWCLFKRESFLQMYLNLCDKLIRYCTAQGTFESGIAYSNNILSHDQAREQTHRQLMRLYYFSGNRTESIRQYKRCVQALHDELGIAPARLTEKLYEQICADLVPTNNLSGLSMKYAANGKDEIGTLVHTLHKLKHVQQDLIQEINHIEAKLNPPPPPS